MTSAIFADVSRSYFEYKIIQPMANILAKFHANILCCYLITAPLATYRRPKSRKHGKAK